VLVKLSLVLSMRVGVGLGVIRPGARPMNGDRGGGAGGFRATCSAGWHLRLFTFHPLGMNLRSARSRLVSFDACWPRAPKSGSKLRALQTLRAGLRPRVEIRWPTSLRADRLPELCLKRSRIS
jgi:hypothetical protein